jgi:hypothetical protein
MYPRGHRGSSTYASWKLRWREGVQA